MEKQINEVANATTMTKQVDKCKWMVEAPKMCKLTTTPDSEFCPKHKRMWGNRLEFLRFKLNQKDKNLKKNEKPLA